VNLKGRIIVLFGIVSGAATILSLNFDNRIVFWGCSTVFVLTAMWWIYTYKDSLCIVRIRRGWHNSLDLLAEMIKKGHDQSVFIYASHNVTEDLDNHEYMKTTKRMLEDSLFDEYTRIVVLRNQTDVESTRKLVREFGHLTNFRLAVYIDRNAFPLNILTISPCHVVFGFPRQPASNSPQGDAYVIHIRSKTLYESLSMLRLSVLEGSILIIDLGHSPENIQESEERLRNAAVGVLTSSCS
jgi:hypothetical protein